MKPPVTKQIKQYKEDGTFKKRKKAAYKLGNNIIDPSLLLNKRAFFSSAGIDIEDYVEENWGFGQPTNGPGILPHKGKNHILVLCFDFGYDTYDTTRDHGLGQTINAVERAFNGFGNRDEYPYESLRNYYLRSSYGKQDIRADVYGWIGIDKVPFGWIDTNGDGIPDRWVQNLSGPNDTFGEFIAQYPELVAEIDWNKYDNDRDGYIEGLFLIWNWYDRGWASMWWPAYYGYGAFGPFTLDNVVARSCVWSWYSRLNYSRYKYDPHTDIHETGHLLGLPDLYDYNASIGPGGGVGGLDMMDHNWGDHNCWSKFMLNWIKPTVIFPFRNNTPKTVELRPTGQYGDAVIIMPNSTQIDPFNDLFMVQYRKRGVGNDPNEVLGGTEDLYPFPGDGLMIWHVDSTLNNQTWGFGYDNSVSAHKYLKLMEADGLNQINQGYAAEVNDFYNEGDEFNDNTTPNSWLYVFEGGEGRKPSGITVDQIGPAGDSMTARFNVVRV